MANKTTEATNLSIDAVSINILQVQLISSSTTVAIGLPCAICNLLLFLAIARTKKLRTNFYLCLMHTAAADTLHSFFFTLVCSKRLILALTNTPETTTPLNCLLIFFPADTFNVVSYSQTITISIDRFLCLAIPLQYHNFRVRRLQIINFAMWIVPIAIMIYACIVYLNPNALISNCTLGIIWSFGFTTVFSNIGLAMDIFIITIYCLLIPMLIARIYVEKKKGLAMAQIKENLDLRALITCFMLLAVYIIFVLGTELFQIGTNTLDTVTRAKMQPITITLSICSTWLSFFVCFARTEDIRTAIKRMLTPRTQLNRVGPAQLPSSGNT